LDDEKEGFEEEKGQINEDMGEERKEEAPVIP